MAQDNTCLRFTAAGSRKRKHLSGLRWRLLSGERIGGWCGLLRVQPQSCEVPQAWFPPGNGPSILPHLEHLVLDRIPAFSDLQLRALPRQGALCSLVLRVTYRVTPQGLRDALPGLSNLRRLELCGCSMPAEGVLQIIGGFLPRLRELRVTVAGLTARGLASLMEMQALEILGLLGPPPTPDKLSAKDILTFCLSLPNLRVLSLQGMGLGSADEAILREGLAHCWGAPLGRLGTGRPKMTAPHTFRPEEFWAHSNT